MNLLIKLKHRRTFFRPIWQNNTVSVLMLCIFASFINVCSLLYNLYFLSLKAMFSSTLMQQSTQKRESQMYDDLSSFIQIFKKVITHLELTVVNIQKGNQYSNIIEKIRMITNQIEPILVKYPDLSANLPIEKITFHRFICRLYETIAVFKIKYQNSATSFPFNCFVATLRGIESVIKKYEEEKQFAKIMQLTHILIIKFCMSCEGNIKNSSRNSQQSLKITDTIKKMNEKMVKFKQQDKKSPQKTYPELSYSDQSDREDSKSVLSQKRTRNMPYNQALMDIQKRYDSFKGMDVDFSFFRTSYFQAKNNYTCFLKDCINRNSPILKLVTSYHDDFELYLKKKETKCYRKNRRLKTNDLSDQKRQRSVDQALKHKGDDNKQSIKLKRNKINQTFDEKLLKEKIINNLKEKDGEATNCSIEANKVSYKMKNIYITLGKKNMNKPYKNNLSPNALKKKIIQNQPINMSFLNEIDGSNTKSIINSLQNKGGYTAEQRMIAQRLKTQGQRLQKQLYEKQIDEDKKMIQDKVIGYISSPNKAQLNGKYLEINCLPIAKEVNSKSRLLLNSNQNKCMIKTQQKTKFLIELKQV